MRRPPFISVVPTLLTLGNAACGFGAITFAARLGWENTAAQAGTHLFVAGLLIFAAMLFDLLDGKAARMVGHSSEFGAQLDSLCDAISFGVAPAFIMLQMVGHADSPLADFSLPFFYHRRILWTIAALYVLCAVMRLARFNVETDEDDSHEEFSGLPSPAAAGVLASFPIAMPELFKMAASSPDSAEATVAAWLIPAVRYALPIITFTVAGLMVSRIRYPHYFTQLTHGTGTRRKVLQIVFGGAAVFTLHELALPMILLWFALTSPLKHGCGKVLAWCRPAGTTTLAAEALSTNRSPTPPLD